MKSRFKKRSIKTLRMAGYFVASIALSLFVLWLARTDLITFIAKQGLEDFGIPNPELSVTAANKDALTIEAVKLETNSGTLTIGQLHLTYSLSGLIKKRRIQDLYIRDALFSAELPANNPDDPSAPSPTLEDLTSYLDLTEFTPLPFDRIQITDSNLSLKSSLPEPSTLSVEATFTASSANTLSVQSKLSTGRDSLELAGEISTPEESKLTAKLKLDSPIDKADQYFANWRADLPDLHTLRSGPAILEATLKHSPDNKANVELAISTSDFDFNYEEIHTSLSSLRVGSTVTDLQEIPIHITLAPESLTRDTISLSSTDPIELQIVLCDFSNINLKSTTPIAWEYDSGFISGTSQLDLLLGLAQESTTLSGTIESKGLTVSDFQFQPITLTLNGDTENINFKTNPISFTQSPLPLLTEGYGTINVPDSDSAPITLTFSSSLNPNAIPGLPTSLSFPNHSLALVTQVFETYSHSAIDLKTLQTSTVFSFSESDKVIGNFALHIDLTQDDATSLLSGYTSLDVSDLSLQFASLEGDGISIQSKTDFQDLSTDLIDSEEDLTTLIETLLPLLTHTTDWQANQLTSGSISAEWSGGSLTVLPTQSGFEATSTLSSGALTLEGLRIEQLYSENEFQGSLENISGTSSLDALLDGIPLSIKTKQAIRNPLNNLSLVGEYEIVPTSFVHSDLISRLFPSVPDVSFSSTVQANGSFHSNNDSTNASLDLKISDTRITAPASKLTAEGIALELHLDSLQDLASGTTQSELTVKSFLAGDLQANDAIVQFRIPDSDTLDLASAEVRLFGGTAFIDPTKIPTNGSDFDGQIRFENLSLNQITEYIEMFDGSMDGSIGGYLPYRFRGGKLELQRGRLTLPAGSTATLRYNTDGLLTSDEQEQIYEKPTLSDRLLKFLKIEPVKVAEQALGNITIREFDAELFPEDTPETPVRIRMGGTAHSSLADIPVVLTTNIHGSLSELYNFLIRLGTL